MKIKCYLTLLSTILVLINTKTEYKVVNKQIGNSFVRLGLQYTGTDDYYIKQKSKIIKTLTFEFQSLTYSDFNFRILDPKNKRFEVPQGGIFVIDPNTNFTYPLNLASFALTYQQDPFTFKVTNQLDSSILFDSSATDLIYSQYFIQIGTYTSSKYLYGLSERFTNSFRVLPGKWTIFNRDRGQRMDTGTGLQTHGYYPIYMLRQPSALYHMSYFRTSNALDAIIEDSSNKYKLTYKTIGGIIDLRFFLGETNPQTMLMKFQNYLGQSAIPPFWSLGFHQCRWGYKNVEALEKVVTNYEKNGIPLDTIWTDIDYLKDYQSFTIDQQRFPLDRMAKIIQKYKYIPIVQPSIKYNGGYAYEEGIKRGIFIKDAQGSWQKGKVWAGSVLFTDYFHPNSTLYWNDMLQSLYSKIKFSGIWLDMNEISNLCNGPCETPKLTGIDFTNDIPYHPGNDSIQTQSIPLNASHYGGLLQANVHAYFGFMETYATNLFLSKRGRPFIITRSTTLGSNRYGFHWTGDNYANYSFLRTSISSNFMFNFWGIQMVGSDICGYGGNATEENCARWFQIGSLYPFARNHNQIQAIDQEPYALGPKVLESSLKNIKLRYSILKAYYRQFIIRRGKGSIFRPLFFQFYDDFNTFNDDIADTQFLIGQSLMAAPILEQNTQQRQVYFPVTNWYDLHTGRLYPAYSVFNIKNSITDLVPIFIREGSLIFRQDVTNVTQTNALKNEFYLVGAFTYSKNKSTSSIDTYESSGGVLSIQNYDNQTLVSECQDNGCDYQVLANLSIEKITNLKKIILQISYIGNKITQQTIQVSKFSIFTQNKIINAKGDTILEIKGPGKLTVNLVQQQVLVQ